MFERPHLQGIIKRVLEPRRFIQVIMGPRQVGKTTLVTQLVEQLKIPYHFVSADAIAASNTAIFPFPRPKGRGNTERKNPIGTDPLLYTTVISSSK